MPGRYHIGGLNCSNLKGGRSCKVHSRNRTMQIETYDLDADSKRLRYMCDAVNRLASCFHLIISSPTRVTFLLRTWYVRCIAHDADCRYDSTRAECTAWTQVNVRTSSEQRDAGSRS
jgi:hypothetical protein